MKCSAPWLPASMKFRSLVCMPFSDQTPEAFSEDCRYSQAFQVVVGELCSRRDFLTLLWVSVWFLQKPLEAREKDYSGEACFRSKLFFFLDLKKEVVPGSSLNVLIWGDR